MNRPQIGRPRASSREVLAEAACELFLEKGYDDTSVADITRRAGVSRSSFFNYFASKGDVLWSGLDARVAALADRLEADEDPDAAASVRALVGGFGSDFAPDSLALAIAHAEAMGLTGELERESAVRRARIAAAVSARLRRGGAHALRAEVLGAAYGGAVLAAIEQWALEGAGAADLGGVLGRALAEVATLPAGSPVRQLRLVARADDFEAALTFYRDVVGMPQAAAFEAEGGARVAILDAGRATLEIANPAQVAFIDGIETDGGRSDALRVALEVGDAPAVAARLQAAGAVVEAPPRETPWRSVNARLRAPAQLQLTVFHELDPS